MAAQVNFFCFLMYFSVWLAIWSLKISTFVLIKVLLAYLLICAAFIGVTSTKTYLSMFGIP